MDGEMNMMDEEMKMMNMTDGEMNMMDEEMKMMNMMDEEVSDRCRSRRRRNAARKRRARRALFRKYARVCPAEYKEFCAALKQMRAAQSSYRDYCRKKCSARRRRSRSDYRRAIYGIAQARAQFHHANIRRKNTAKAFYAKIKAVKRAARKARIEGVGKLAPTEYAAWQAARTAIKAARKAYRKQRLEVVKARRRRNRAAWQKARLELIRKGQAFKAARKTFYAAKKAFILKIRAARAGKR